MNNIFKTTLLFLILIEILSLFGFLVPAFNSLACVIILAVIAIIAVRNLELALLIVIAELIIGSKGYLFSFTIGEFELSLRIGLWLVVMSVWLGKTLMPHKQVKGVILDLIGDPETNKKQKEFFSFLDSPASWRGNDKNIWVSLCALSIVILWGLMWGLLRNDFENVFFDFNNWLYWLYLFPFISVIRTRIQFDTVKHAVAAGLAIIAAKTLIYLYIFSHGFVWAVLPLYRWARASGVGEITLIGGNFYRVFFQSHVWVVIGLVVAVVLWRRDTIEKKKAFFTVALLGATVLLSFSRSFWVGLAGALGFFILYVARKNSVKQSIVLTSKLILVGVAAAAVTALIAYLPPQGKPLPLSSLVSDRLTKIEAAGSSRINLLQPLWQKIIEHPVIGSGFGTTVTYTSADPRVRSQTPLQSGQYTTYAFEWGYLDFIVKFGLGGLVVVLTVLYAIGKRLYRLGQDDGLGLGLFLGLISMSIIHIFTPYLNHPLGIGFLLLCVVYVSIEKAALTHA